MAVTLEAVDNFILDLVQSLDTCYYDFVIQDAPKDSTDYTKTHTLLFPTGAYAARLWQPGDDIRLVFMTSNSPRIFWDMALEKLGLDESGMKQKNQQIQLPRSVLARHLSQVNLCGTNISLHHCPFPPNFDFDLIDHYGLSSLSQSSSRNSPEAENLRLVQDAWSLYRIRIDASPEIPLSIFDDAYKRIRSWSIAVGIYAPVLGYLNSDSLLGLMATSFRWWQSTETASKQDFVEYFLADGGGIDSSPQSSKQNQSINADNNSLEAAHPFTGKLHLTKHTSESNASILDAFAFAKSKLPNTDILDTTPQEGFHQFLSDKSFSFVRMDASCWAQSISKRAEFTRSLPSILQDIACNIRSSTFQNGLMARIWPWPIEELETATETYIIGIHQRDTQHNKPLDLDNINGLVDSLVDKIQYDCDTAYISLASAQREEILNLPAPHIKFVLSPKPTSNHAKANDQAEPNPSTEPKIETATNPPTATSNPHKFRPSSSAISRLRFDPIHKNTAYEVGYLDRFDGIKWMTLDHWGRKVTEDEDFIPIHRVQILRRVEDGVEVWNREMRVDFTGGGG
ncbi:Hypothetical protein R9X50_00462500 [Acrodontium crateriforme]|uniref:MJ1316 RNA cyclic group end recognition domain-containing protein n=1 Tax=Acrodontium crateriforme TaxID=150365 RepID=A0AAQ3M5T0_9PEZI|nr:Hypothetical protein R9X50_00462500 [Acrodontium crateriforme]